jgi:hypothetical protein
MRPATGLIGIISVLMGLWTGPFFHIHEVDDSDTHDHLATLHSHLSEEWPEQNFSGTRIENGRHRDHGIAVTVIAGRGRKVQTVVVELQSSNMVFEPSILTGFGVDVPVRAHDPPTRRSSSPRSPPVQTTLSFLL